MPEPRINVARMQTHVRRSLLGIALVGLGACNDVGCWWTDDPNRDPWMPHEPDRSYRSADGAFDVVLHADDSWPMTIGVQSVRISWAPIEATSAGGTADAQRPFTRDGDRIADANPSTVELEPLLWRIETLAFDVAGEWNVPVVLEQGELDDSIELHFDVAE